MGRSGPWGWSLLLALVAGLGCAVGPQPEPVSPLLEQRVTREDLDYLRPPLQGYPLVASPQQATVVSQAFEDLVAAAVLAEARQRAEALLERDPSFQPALVLLAQVEFIRTQYAEAAARLRPVVEELDDYTAAQLLYGRTAEKLGELVEAYTAYRSMAEVDSVAAGRAGELRSRVLEIVLRRLEDALERGHLEAAEDQLARLREWAPEEPVTLEGERQVAAAAGDLQRELKAVQSLLEIVPEDPSLLERRAVLETLVGDVGVGVKLLDELAGRYPDDAALQRKLKAAKFRWRLRLLPEEVRQLVSRAELNRGDYAILLYWLIPGVRYERSSSGRIAADILDHEWREAIARVVNLELMTVDESLHRFRPEEQLRRGTALSSVLRVARRYRSDASCLQLGGFESAGGWDAVCQTAASCELIAAPEDCLPAAPVSGQEAVEIIRRVLLLLGAS